MNSLNEHIWIEICEYLTQKEVWILLSTVKSFEEFFSNSTTLIRNFTFLIDKNNYEIIIRNHVLEEIEFKNVSADFNNVDPKIILKLLKNYEKSTENLTINNLKNNDFNLISNYLSNFRNLNTINLKNCEAKKCPENLMSQIKSLKSVLFQNCDEFVFEIFKNQENLEKLTICNYEYTFNGFSHDKFNELAKSLPNLRYLVFEGDGTSSYFDECEFPFKIETLNTTSITFNWYVGLKTARLDFLKTQLGFLKELTIHKLPNDFDGDKVIKFIVEEMKLSNFFYGSTPLILDGKKQEITEFFATETQIQSAFEMFRQFRSIKKFCLLLNNVDICSDSIEKVVNPKTNLFCNLKEFKLIDNNKSNGIFGVFLGLYQNLTNIEKLMLDTQDRNINVVLEECLPSMKNLKEIYLTSKVPKADCRFKIIKKYVKGLKIMTIPVEFVQIAKKIFGKNVEIIGI